jgi:hypothetical protein
MMDEVRAPLQEEFVEENDDPSEEAEEKPRSMGGSGSMRTEGELSLMRLSIPD